MLARGLVTGGASVCAVVAFAQSVTFPPLPTGSYVRDEMNVVTASDRAEIDRLSTELYNAQGFPIAVAVIRSKASHSATSLTIEQYARLLFDHWGPGTTTNNKGMLLLVSIEDRKARIEFGAGWMGQADDDAQAVMDGMIIPQFKAGNYSTGILEGVRGMYRIGNGEEFAQPSGGIDLPFPDGGSPDPSLIVMCCAAPAAILMRFLGGGWGGRGMWTDSYYHDHDGWGGGGGWGGNGGGGGGGFGGGSGGGGGASGSW